MSDFAQPGLITTLQRLNDSHLPNLEAELGELAAARPITLVLPCHGDDIAQPALAHIIGELSGAAFLREVIFSVNGANAETLARLRELCVALPQSVRILNSDEAKFQNALGAIRLPPDQSKCAARSGAETPPVIVGKGLNVWRAIGLVCAEARSEIIVVQDCDVASFRRENLARLCFAAVHPELRYALAKMYYSRVTDRIYGRVSRLFFAPLLAALTRTCGHRPLLDFLQSFRYPLAGETAFSRELAGALPMQSGWGFELGVLCESFRNADSRRIAQVDGGPRYEHRHQPLGDESGGLFRMAREIAQTLFAQLAAEGLVLDLPFFTALRESFARESRDALRRSRHLALINGISPDAESETAARLFARVLESASADFRLGVTAPALPAWQQIVATKPALVRQFLAASPAE